MTLGEKRIEFIRVNLLKGYSLGKIMKALKLDERRLMDLMRLHSDVFKKIVFIKR